MRKSLLFKVICLLFIMKGLFAETTVSGGNVAGVWTVAGSPFLIEGDIVVPAGSWN